MFRNVPPVMNFRRAFISLAVLLVSLTMWAQLPPDQALPLEDQREFEKELVRLKVLLPAANDKPAIELQIANTYAAAGKYTEAMERLRSLVRADLGFDPSRDPDFVKLRDTSEFRSVMNDVRRQTAPVHNSRLIATLEARDIRPENIAFDVKRSTFLLGNTVGFELVRCSLAGHCVPFVAPNSGEQAYSLGLKINRSADEVWVTYNAPDGAGLRCYDLETGKLLRTASIPGKHLFNDLVISSGESVYVTDTAEGAVYHLSHGQTALKRIAPQHAFTAANGIAISDDDRRLYVSTWNDGVDLIDLQSGTVAPMAHPENVCLAFIDGLYADHGALIAIQNGPMSPRIVAFRMSADGSRITSVRILERRNPAFDGITTGVIVGRDLYYVANPQTDRQEGVSWRPLQIFSVGIAKRKSE